MKAIFQSRPDCLINPGGDTVQMWETMDALRKLDVEVDISLEPTPSLKQYDLVHIFNIQTSVSGVRYCQNAIRQGCPIVLSTIFWDPSPLYTDPNAMRYIGVLPDRLVLRLVPLATTPYLSLTRHLRGRRRRRAAREMLASADLVLPNSYAESESLVYCFRAPWVRCKTLVIPNGVREFHPADREQFITPIPADVPAEFVLQVGRIEPCKNQLRLIQALMPLPSIPLVFIGRESSASYALACRRAAQERGNTWFMGELRYRTVVEYYRRARVHALPSLLESTGLVTLEAASQGANCVVSQNCPVTEYFARYAWCCDPMSIDSIRIAVLKAWKSSRRQPGETPDRAAVTWPTVAEITLEAYRKVLAKAKNASS